MEWSDLRYFLAVARAGRLAAAARGLGVEHTTVSRRIAALEDALGAHLFQRTAAGLRLTKVGEQILPRAEAMELEARALQATSYATVSRVAGVVRIAAIESWAAAFIAPNVPALRARHPELDVEILTGHLPLSLTRGEADVAFRVPKPKQPDLTATALGPGTIRLFGVPALADRWRRALDEGRAEGVPLGVFTPELDFLVGTPAFRALVSRGDVRLRTSSTLTLLSYALTGDALVPLPTFVAASEPRLVRAGRHPIVETTLWIASHKEVRRDPRIAAVYRWARDVLAPVIAAAER